MASTSGPNAAQLGLLIASDIWVGCPALVEAISRRWNELGCPSHIMSSNFLAVLIEDEAAPTVRPHATLPVVQLLLESNLWQTDDEIFSFVWDLWSGLLKSIYHFNSTVQPII